MEIVHAWFGEGRMEKDLYRYLASRLFHNKLEAVPNRDDVTRHGETRYRHTRDPPSVSWIGFLDRPCGRATWIMSSVY